MPRIALTLLGFALVLAAPTARAMPMFMGLGGVDSSAQGVSADGSVVVGSRHAGEAFRWTATGGMVGLGYLPGGAMSNANAASADGSVVVGEAATTPQGAYQAFRWTPQGGMISLDSLPGDTAAFGVSDDGSVVVGGTSEVLVPEAFRWTEGTGMLGLGLLPGATESQASGVSADGSVVVGYSGSSSFAQAFLWTAEGGMVGIGLAATYSYANDVSADGSVVVGDAGDQAFRWTEGTGMVGLGMLPGAMGSQASSVSADGSVVVGTSDTAFVWDSVHGMRSLQQVLTNDYGFDLSDWTLSHATAVSADGRTIVGYGTNPSGQEEAWIAFLPEPSAALLVALGIAGLAAWRRQLV